MSDQEAAASRGHHPVRRAFFGLAGVYVKPSAHVAHFFRTEEERLSVLLPFIAAGIAAGEHCVLVDHPKQFDRVRRELTGLGSDVSGALSSGQMLELTPDEASSTIEQVVAKAHGDGRMLVRVGEDVTTAIGTVPTAEKLMELEAEYDRYVSSQPPILALCQYDYSRFPGTAIMYALQVHPLSIIGNVVQETPFYRRPDEVLKELASAPSTPL